ncbi:hypothetical protein ACFL2V_16345 [Pseudomonadota bacterium]
MSEPIKGSKGSLNILFKRVAYALLEDRAPGFSHTREATPQEITLVSQVPGLEEIAFEGFPKFSEEDILPTKAMLALGETYNFYSTFVDSETLLVPTEAPSTPRLPLYHAIARELEWVDDNMKLTLKGVDAINSFRETYEQADRLTFKMTL